MGKGKSIFSLITGLTLGAAIGAAAGVLYAPKEGKETRKDLKKKADEIREQGMDSLKNINETKIKPELEQVKKSIEENSEKLGKELTTKIKSISNEIKKELSKPGEKKAAKK